MLQAHSSSDAHLNLKRRPGKSASYLVKIEMSKKGAPKSVLRRSSSNNRKIQRRNVPQEKAAKAMEIGQLIEKVRQIIYETPEVRDEKVASVLEAVEEGTYKIDSRQLANILITKLLLDR